MKRKLNWLAIAMVVILGGCFPYYVTETPELSGRVVDSRSGQAIVARLYYKDFSDQVIVSSVDGEFKFPSIRRLQTVILGTDHMPVRILVIEANGYQSVTKAIDLGGPDTIVISLDASK
jgi:hypothetical protein